MKKWKFKGIGVGDTVYIKKTTTLKSKSEKPIKKKFVLPFKVVSTTGSTFTVGNKIYMKSTGICTDFGKGRAYTLGERDGINGNIRDQTIEVENFKSTVVLHTELKRKCKYIASIPINSSILVDVIQDLTSIQEKMIINRGNDNG